MSISTTRRPLFSAAATVAALLLATSIVLGHENGALPGTNSVPSNATTGFPSCGSCHGSGSPGERGPVTVRFTGSASLVRSTSATLTLAISSAVAGNQGGFALTSDKGAFTAGPTTRASSNGRALSHSSPASRSWSFGFKSDTTGLVQWFAVGNTVNGNRDNSGDSWGWYGANPSLPGQPFRLYVNDSQVTPYGQACAGTGGFEPLLGAAQNATRGQAFPVDLYNVPPSTVAIGTFGFSDKAYGPLPLPLALDAFGAPGCRLQASMDILAPVATTGSGPGNGKATFPYAIPAIPSLLGLPLYLSALVLDKVNPLGLTTSNGLRAVIQ